MAPAVECVIANLIANLQAQLNTVSGRVDELDPRPRVFQFDEVQVPIGDPNLVSLDMFKTLHEFSGDRNKYAAWRNAAKTAIRVFGDIHTSVKYFEALNIIRHKITGAAAVALTNYNTVFNFDAIIARLDFKYADQRPAYIIEQEMTLLQQKSSSVEDFYDEIINKLNALIRKINMTHSNAAIANAMIRDASDKALRTFVTGLRVEPRQINPVFRKHGRNQET